MSFEEDARLCPLFSIAFRREVECMKEKCAWWNSKTELCIIQDLGTIADWAYSPHILTDKVEVST